MSFRDYQQTAYILRVFKMKKNKKAIMWNEIILWIIFIVILIVFIIIQTGLKDKMISDINNFFNFLRF